MSKDKLIESIEKMKVSELVELVEALKEKFNVQGSPVAMAAAPAASDDAGDSGLATSCRLDHKWAQCCDCQSRGHL